MKAIGAEVGAHEQTVARALRRNGIDRPEGFATRIELDRAWLEQVYSVDRLPVAQIAQLAGVGVVTINRRRAEYGIPIRPRLSPATGRARPRLNSDRPGGIDPGWLRVEYIQRHRTIREIAELAGVSVTTMHRAINVHGLTRSSVRRSRSALNDATWLRVRYIDEHATAGDIANELDVPMSTVRTALRRQGVRRGGR
ncbi:MAG TPA: hypothetical protein VMW33_14365 [Ilumatobacteraceae bacterium]|nr:hypothetical protein [Ilumatobacteraceae bacterium]